jgi:hypothetical protein
VSVPAPHDEPQSVAPHVHVVRGAPDEVELAALVAGLVATAAEPEESPAPAGSEWSNRRRTLMHHPSPAPGPDAWRWSLHP